MTAAPAEQDTDLKDDAADRRRVGIFTGAAAVLLMVFPWAMFLSGDVNAVQAAACSLPLLLVLGASFAWVRNPNPRLFAAGIVGGLVLTPLVMILATR